MLDSDQWYFSTDTVSVSFDETDGVVEEHGETEFHWDAIPTVNAEDIPENYREFFGADEFYKFSATVARPIPQKYVIAGDEYTFKKPPDELQKAAWSLDNKPWTLDHPKTKAVKSVDQIHGFWKNPRWIGDTQDLDLDLYFPTNDERAREYVSETDEVSVGFTHRLRKADESGIDAYQTNMYFDHVASVENGRCSGEEGCGLNVDHAHSFGVDTLPQLDDGGVIDDSKFVNEDKWYAVPPSDNPDDEWKFPINNCEDVGDAWHFAVRERGSISISWDTLKSRIKRRASDLGCDVPSEESEDSFEADTASNWYQKLHENTTMTECDCGGDGASIMDIDEMAVDAVRRRHDGVDEQLTEYEESLDEYKAAAKVAEDAREALELDEDASLVDAIETLQDERETLADERDELQTKLDEAREDEIEDMRETLVEHTSMDEEDVEEMEYDELKEKVDFLDVIETEGEGETSPTTADSDPSGGDGGDGGDDDEPTVAYNPQY